MADKEHKSTPQRAEELGLIALPPSQVIPHALECIKDDMPLIMIGPPGCGKTDLMGQISAIAKKSVWTERLNGKDPTDFSFPRVYQDCMGVWRNGGTSPEFFHSSTEETPDGFSGGWTLFFDDFGQAVTAVINRAGEMMHEKRLNSVGMHPKVWIAGATNFASDKAGSIPIPRHVTNRASVIVVTPNAQDFIDRCAVTNLAPEIPAYAKINPGCIDSYEPDALVNCTARSLASLSDALKRNAEHASGALFSTIVSRIGRGHGSAFFAHLQTWQEMTSTYSIEKIVQSPLEIPLPEPKRTDIMCTLAAMIGANMTKANAERLVMFLKRMTSEYCVFALRDASRRKPELLKTKTFIEWVTGPDGDALE